MNSKVYKCCAVPQCVNTSIKTPNKLFVYVRRDKKIRNEWFNLARRDPTTSCLNSSIYFCEDHFDLPNDMENFMEYHVMGSVSQVRMKPGCIPTKFECQSDRRKRTSRSKKRPHILKKQRKILIEECMNDLEETSITKKNLTLGESSSGCLVSHANKEKVSREQNNVDKLIQVHMIHKFRSKAIQTAQKPKDGPSSTSPCATKKPPPSSAARQGESPHDHDYEAGTSSRPDVNDDDLNNSTSTKSGNMSITHLPPEILRSRYLCVDHFNKKYVRNVSGKRKRLQRTAVPELYQASDAHDEFLNHTDTHSDNYVQAEGEEWLSWPDACRCCLATRGVWDLTGSYMAEDGETEVFLQMLTECYGIKLSHVSEFGPSRLVCAECAASLRRANRFKRQVLQAEERFAAHYGKTEVLDIKIKEEYPEDSNDFESHENVITDQYSETEVKVEYESMDQEYEEISIPQTSTQHVYETSSNLGTIKQPTKRMLDTIEGDSDDSTDDTTPVNRPLATLPQKQTKEITYNKKKVQVLGCPKKDDVTKNIERRKGKGRGKKIKVQASTSATDDTTLENLGQSEPVQIGSMNTVDMLENVKSEETQVYGSHSVKTKPPARAMNCEVKPVSQRKRIKLTCETVLGYTTACPFRHSKSWFQCFYCTLEVMEINMLREHIAEKHEFEDIAAIKRYPRTLQIDITRFQCKICSVNLTDVDDMIAHFSEVHDKVVYKECVADYKVNVSPYCCHLCGKEYHVFRSLTTHLNDHYANCICDICGKSFINSKRLKVHKRTHEKGIFPCDKCGKVLKTMTSKVNHMDSHSNRVMKCHVCLKTMKHYNDRIKHMSEAHNVSHTFKCHICGKEYNIKHYLATHMRQTHGHKNKKCAECGMAFVTNHGLKKHMLKHSGVKAFSCAMCNKSYARSYTLTEHMRAHDSDKFAS